MDGGQPVLSCFSDSDGDSGSGVGGIEGLGGVEGGVGGRGGDGDLFCALKLFAVEIISFNSKVSFFAAETDDAFFRRFEHPSMEAQ